MWNKFEIKEIYAKGILTSYSAECKCHFDVSKNDCARSLAASYGQQEALKRLKRWLFAGRRIDVNDRKKHMDPSRGPRTFDFPPPMSHMKEAFDAGEYTEAELKDLCW